MILACTQKFLTFMPCALFSYFSRCNQTYSFSQCQVLDSSSRDLRSSTCFMSDSSRKDMRSFISLGNFFLQIYYSCFQRISFQYFKDFISRFKAISDFLRPRISVVFSWSQLLTNPSYSFNLSSQVAYSFSFLMLNFIFSSSLKPASRLSRITQSSNSIISLFFNYNSSLRSYWQSLPVEGCRWKLADSVQNLDLGQVLSVRSELSGVQLCFSLVGVWAMRMNKSSVLMKFTDILCSLIFYFYLLSLKAGCSAIDILLLLLLCSFESFFLRVKRLETVDYAKDQSAEISLAGIAAYRFLRLISMRIQQQN